MIHNAKICFVVIAQNTQMMIMSLVYYLSIGKRKCKNVTSNFIVIRKVVL